MLMTGYTYTVDYVNGANVIVLTETDTGKQKQFVVAGAERVKALSAHMDSLTDSLCEQWFNPGRGAKRAKPVKGPKLTVD